MSPISTNFVSRTTKKKLEMTFKESLLLATEHLWQPQKIIVMHTNMSQYAYTSICKFQQSWFSIFHQHLFFPDWKNLYQFIPKSLTMSLRPYKITWSKSWNRQFFTIITSSTLVGRLKQEPWRSTWRTYKTTLN